jgi:hypothetical protein
VHREQTRLHSGLRRTSTVTAARIGAAAVDLGEPKTLV